MSTPNSDITIYSKDRCVQCVGLKRNLDAAGVIYEEINLSRLEPEEQERALAMLKADGHLQAPVTYFTNADGDREHFGGFNPNKADELKALAEAERELVAA